MGEGGEKGSAGERNVINCKQRDEKIEGEIEDTELHVQSSQSGRSLDHIKIESGKMLAAVPLNTPTTHAECPKKMYTHFQWIK